MHVLKYAWRTNPTTSVWLTLPMRHGHDTPSPHHDVVLQVGPNADVVKVTPKKVEITSGETSPRWYW